MAKTMSTLMYSRLIMLTRTGLVHTLTGWKTPSPAFGSELGEEEGRES